MKKIKISKPKYPIPLKNILNLYREELSTSKLKNNPSKTNEIIEKKAPKNKFIDPALIGTFSFSSGSLFLELANQLINDRKTINNEFYVDSCINYGIKKGLKVIYFKVNYFLCWGTPNDLMIYNYWQDYFDKNKDHPYSKQLDIDYF